MRFKMATNPFYQAFSSTGLTSLSPPPPYLLGNLLGRDFSSVSLLNQQHPPGTQEASSSSVPPSSPSLASRDGREGAKKLRNFCLLFSVSVKPSRSDSFPTSSSSGSSTSHLSPSLPQDATNTLAVSPSGDLLFVATSVGSVSIFPLTRRGTPCGRLCRNDVSIRKPGFLQKKLRSSIPSRLEREGLVGQMSLWAAPLSPEHGQEGAVNTPEEARRSQGRHGAAESRWIEEIPSTSEVTSTSEEEGEDHDIPSWLSLHKDDKGEMGKESRGGRRGSKRSRRFLPERYTIILPTKKTCGRGRREDTEDDDDEEEEDDDEDASSDGEEGRRRKKRQRITHIACEVLAGDEVLLCTTRGGDVMLFSLNGIRERLNREKKRRREKRRKEREERRQARAKEEEAEAEAEDRGLNPEGEHDTLRRDTGVSMTSTMFLHQASSRTGFGEEELMETPVTAAERERRAREEANRERLERKRKLEKAQRERYNTPVPDVWIQ